MVYINTTRKQRWQENLFSLTVLLWNIEYVQKRSAYFFRARNFFRRTKGVEIV